MGSRGVCVICRCLDGEEHDDNKHAEFSRTFTEMQEMIETNHESTTAVCRVLTSGRASTKANGERQVVVSVALPPFVVPGERIRIAVEWERTGRSYYDDTPVEKGGNG
jgi:hypothetical protein